MVRKPELRLSIPSQGGGPVPAPYRLPKGTFLAPLSWLQLPAKVQLRFRSSLVLVRDWSGGTSASANRS